MAKLDKTALHFKEAQPVSQGTTINKGLLPPLSESPKETYKREHAQHGQQEERASESICNGCRYAFIFSQGESRWDKEPQLRTCCTAPWFRDAMPVEHVTNCNGFMAGPFDPLAYDLSKALGDDGEEDELEDLDKVLDQLEAEDAGDDSDEAAPDNEEVTKGLPSPEDRADKDDDGGGVPAAPGAEPDPDDEPEEDEADDSDEEEKD